MLVELDLWSAGMLLTKWFSYICFVCLAGGLFARQLDSRIATQCSGALDWPFSQSFRLYLMLVAMLGVLLSGLALLLQVGSINQNGLAGMFDWFMVQLIAQSSAGGGNGLRALGFVLLGLSAVRLAAASPLSKSQLFGATSLLAYLAGLGCFVLSFAFLGHVAPLTGLDKLAIVLHVAAVGLWLGALPVLWNVCLRYPPEQLHALMRAFGAIAWWVLAALLAGGIYVLLSLLGSVEQMFSSSYGLVFTAKLLLVLLLLMLAASNKFILVARADSGDATLLRRSIFCEMILALIILLVTAVLTTFVGPAQMAM